MPKDDENKMYRPGTKALENQILVATKTEALKKRSGKNRGRPYKWDDEYNIVHEQKEAMNVIKNSTADTAQVCRVCGKVFVPPYIPTQDKRYGVELCESCSSLVDKQLEHDINIEVDYAPHWGQQLFHESNARFRVLCTGVRFGKDRGCCMEFIQYLLDCSNEERGRNMVPKVFGWVIAPTEKIARQNWRELCAAIPKEIVINASPTTMTIELINDVLIEVHSAYDPEALVGVGLDAVWITEAARIGDLETVWSNLEGRLNSPGRGRNGKGGIGLINSSPLGENYFYEMFCWGQKNHGKHDPSWESWRFTTWDNPYMATRGNEMQANGRTYRQNLERRMSKVRYMADYMAEFMRDAYAMFPDFVENCMRAIPANISDEQRKKIIDEWHIVNSDMIYKIGYDPAGEGEDEPIAWVRDQRGKIVEIINMFGFGWDMQFDYLAKLSKKYNNAVVAFGRTGHETIDSQLIKRDVVTEPINEQGSNKQSLVEHLAWCVEQKYLQILDDGSDEIEKVKGQFRDFKKKKNGRYQHARASGHDDHVSAAYFCFHDFELPNEIDNYGFVGACYGA